MAAATDSQLGDSLDHRRAETEPVQPVRQHRTRHAGARDQHTRALNRHVFSRRRLGQSQHRRLKMMYSTTPIVTIAATASG